LEVYFKMKEMTQEIIVYIIIALTVVGFYFLFIKKKKTKKNNCNGCTGCSLKEQCSDVRKIE